MNNHLISIIIICEKWNSFLEEALPYYEKLDYPNFEIFVFSTEKIDKKYPKVKFIADPKLKNKPAEKRDMAIKHAKGEIYAFIDDDAFPHPNWLKNAVKHFKKSEIAAVGGPGTNPPNISTFEQASGWIRASPLGGFGTNHCYIPKNKKLTDDHPSMNLLVRASDFKKIGGFDSSYYPGEDTKLCLDLTKKLGKKIIYDPDVLVYHHKRPLFKKHLIQNGRYGLHRGHFARILPETSRRWFYFIPSVFSLGLLVGLSLFVIGNTINLQNTSINTLLTIFYIAMAIYSVFLIANSVWILRKSKSAGVAFLSIPGIFTTHFWYGLRFIQGFLSSSMQDRYGRSE